MNECFVISGSKNPDPDDSRYYVQITVHSPYCKLSPKLDFLIDTGANRTLVRWNSVSQCGIPIDTLPEDHGKVFLGVGGGRVIGRLLPQSTLTFESSNGRLDLKIGDLSVAEFQTGYAMDDPGSSSILGLDVLHKFDLQFTDDSSALNLKYKAKC